MTDLIYIIVTNTKFIDRFENEATGTGILYFLPVVSILAMHYRKYKEEYRNN